MNICRNVRALHLVSNISWQLYLNAKPKNRIWTNPVPKRLTLNGAPVGWLTTKLAGWLVNQPNHIKTHIQWFWFIKISCFVSLRLFIYIRHFFYLFLSIFLINKSSIHKGDGVKLRLMWFNYSPNDLGE